MSEYELLAEKNKYFRFEQRPMVQTCPHFHRAIELLFIEHAPQKVVIGGEQYILQPGEGCFSDSFCVHSYEKDESVPSTYIVGDRTYFDRFFHAKGDKIPPRFFRFDNFKLLHFLRGLCNQNYQNDEDRYATIEGAMHILLAEIAQKNTFVSHNADRQDMLVRNVLLYADKHANENLSLEALTGVFSVSKEHLSRTLHKHLQENWSSYLARLRVKRAHELLQEHPELSVLDAAFLCGFESANTFYRAYKKEFNKSPRA